MPPKKAPERKEPSSEADKKEMEHDTKRQAVSTKLDSIKRSGEKAMRNAKDPTRRSARQQTANSTMPKKGYGSAHHSTEGLPQAASLSRLPNKGQKVQWKAMPGICHGEVIEVIKSEKTVEGKKIKASKNDPRIVIKSTGPSGKIAVHKVDKVYF